MDKQVSNSIRILCLSLSDGGDDDDEYTNLLQSLLSALSIHIFLIFHLLLLVFLMLTIHYHPHLIIIDGRSISEATMPMTLPITSLSLTL